MAEDIRAREEPPLAGFDNAGHSVACHLVAMPSGTSGAA